MSEAVPEVTFGFFLVLFITILASLTEKQSALQRVHLGGLQRAATLRIFFFAPLEYLFDLLLMFFGAVLQSTVS